MDLEVSFPGFWESLCSEELVPEKGTGSASGEVRWQRQREIPSSGEMGWKSAGLWGGEAEVHFLGQRLSCAFREMHSFIK